MITDISQLDPNGTCTYADYLKWQFDEWVELIRGRWRIFNKPGKSPLHQRVVQTIGHELNGRLNKSEFESWSVPLPVILGHQSSKKSPNLVIPDFFMINKKNDNYADETGWHGVPDRVIEVTDEHTFEHDTLVKLGLYQDAGVREYWIIQPKEQAVNVYTLEDGPYALVDVYESGNIPCRLFPDLIVAHERIFR